MILRPGSLAWLVAHDLRLSWRSFAATLGAVAGRLQVLIVVLAAIALHAIAVPIARWLSPFVSGPDANLPALAAILTCTFTWMLAQSLFIASRTLYVRGDLDLLLGSPLPASRIVAAKAIGIAAGCLGSIAFLALPLANAGAFTQSLFWLALYPLLISYALLASALGLVLTVMLFGMLGPRRARLWTQMTGAFIAGAFVLGAQVVAMLPTRMRGTMTVWIEAQIARDAAGPWSLLRLPIDAFHGNQSAVLTLLALSVLAFAAATGLLGQRFIAMSLAAAGAAALQSSDAEGRRRPIRFAEGLALNMWRKEWRLLARDPGMFAQLALQIIYTVPVAVVLLRNETLPPVFALAPTIVVISAQVAASLAWLTVSGEDAPELIATAPVSAATVDRAKLHSVALPVLLLLALPMAALATVSWPGALLTCLIASAAATSTATLNFWHPMPGNRRGMLRRHSQSKLVALIEHALALLWALAVVMALLGSFLAVIPALLVAAILGVMRKGHRAAAA